MHVIDLTHTIDAGHRVVGHVDPETGGPGKCSRLHGHTYRFDITCAADVLDPSGFVVDFGRLKAFVDAWDHRTLLWHEDPLAIEATFHPDHGRANEDEVDLGVVRVPFNPTAENMAAATAQAILDDHDGLVFVEVRVAETPKSSATFRASRSHHPDKAKLVPPGIHVTVGDRR